MPTVVASPTVNTAIIIRVSGILGKPISEAEKLLGSPRERLPIKDEGFGPLVVGGELRAYRQGKYEFTVLYNKSGIAKGFQLSDGLTDENFSLSQWSILFSRFGLQVSKKPDVEAPAGIRWDNYEGYNLHIGALGMEGRPVWTIQIGLVK